MSLADRDRAVVWHPYTQALTADPPIAVARARGAWLETEDGARLLDGISSWWVNVHGHGHPRLVEALARQARQLDHVMLAGLTHEPAVALAEGLARATGLDRVFYTDNGSTAVEAALKMAYQRARHRGEDRRRFLALPHAYHGDTVGAMSVSGLPLFRSSFEDLLFEVDVYEGEVGDDVAAVIVEPLLQGAGGMRVYPPEELAEIAETCRRAGALLIADEVLTGFGRTGTLFACEQAGVRPDLMCLSKGLTAGLLPMGAVVASHEVHDAFLSEDRARTFFHGHSYTGNPLGCAVALESLALFDEGPVLERAREIGRRIRAAIEPLRPLVADVRGVGCVQVVELAGEAGYLADAGRRMGRFAIEQGVLLRPLGNVIYAMPPYCLTDDEADLVGRVLRDAVEVGLAGARL